MKNVVLVAPHFVPSNLAAVHRARLWSQHLAEFGWNPIILTTDSAFYEERVDADLQSLVDPRLEIIRTRALPTKPIRIVGDIGVRAMLPHYRALCRLAEQKRIDFLHITIPSHYSALLGRWLHARYGIPYGIDYIDPWVHEFPGSDKPLTKAWASARLATVLEPWAVRDAALITGVAASYFEAVLDRNPHLRSQAVTAGMPYGISDADFAALAGLSRAPYLFSAEDGNVHVVYAGAMLPKAYPLLEILLQAVALLARRSPAVVERLRLHFVGTGSSPDDPRGHNILPYIQRYGVERFASEAPARIPYLDVLTHLRASAGNLVLGSTERHYTPSKAFQNVQAGRPVLAILHDESSAADFLTRARAGTVVTFSEGTLPTIEEMATRLQDFLTSIENWRGAVDTSVFAEYSARHSAKVLADALDRALVARAPRRAVTSREVR
jgi:hypothetical protein